MQCVFSLKYYSLTLRLSARVQKHIFICVRVQRRSVVVVVHY